jgi:signal transduction histidine kinase
VNLHKIIVEKIRLFDLMIQRKQNRLQNLVSTEIIIPADSFIVSMAIQNILGNAIHHTKNGDIQIIYQQSDLAHQIIITDTGIGLNTAKIELQTSNNMNEVSTPLSGYGIGLKIANQLLELINGNIEVKPNDKGKGTMAIIYIRKSNT